MMRSLLLFLLPVSAWATYDWTCNLHCYNDGECKHGKGKFGSYAGVEEEEEMPWEKAAPHPVGMYCSCPIGYTGLQCEIHMKTCGNDEHTCFNGAPCGKERAGDGTTWWRCECDPTDSVMDADYAGRYCEHIATIFCNNNPDDIGHEGTSYCTNGGKCKEKDHEGQKHVGCICLDGYDGEHCEINTAANALTLNDIAVAATSEKSIGLIVALVTVGVFVALFFLWFYDKREKKRRRRKRMQNAGIQSTFNSNENGEMI